MENFDQVSSKVRSHDNGAIDVTTTSGNVTTTSGDVTTTSGNVTSDVTNRSSDVTGQDNGESDVTTRSKMESIKNAKNLKLNREFGLGVAEAPCSPGGGRPPGGAEGSCSPNDVTPVNDVSVVARLADVSAPAEVDHVDKVTPSHKSGPEPVDPTHTPTPTPMEATPLESAPTPMEVTPTSEPVDPAIVSETSALEPSITSSSAPPQFTSDFEQLPLPDQHPSPDQEQPPPHDQQPHPPATAPEAAEVSKEQALISRQTEVRARLGLRRARLRESLCRGQKPLVRVRIEQQMQESA